MANPNICVYFASNFMTPPPKEVFSRMGYFSRPLVYALALGAGCFTQDQLQADVKLPAIIGDHMVLQRDISVPIWGWADPGETVKVTAGSNTATTTASPDGKWSVKLSTMAASDKPIDVTIAGKNTIVLHDVLVGDVWVCSGQSNMEFGIKAFMTKEELDAAGEPLIRLFSVPKYVAPNPSPDIGVIPPNSPATALGKWQVCTPLTLVATGEWSGFPAVAYYFGREIQRYTKQPVGLIGSTWGGTRINSWTSLEALQSEPSMASLASGGVKFRDNYEQIKTAYENDALPQYKAELEKWKQENQPAIEAFEVAMKDWREKSRAAAAQKQPGPPRPVSPKEPRAPRDPIHDNQTSVALFNGMIAPIIPYSIKGAIWYQGESNGDQPDFYRLALPLLIKDWRAQWNQGNFPFLIVQLPNYMQKKPAPSESSWAGVRDAQTAAALDQPNTGIAVTIDIGDANNIHPPDKFDVGQRLALVAQRVAYGDQKTVYAGPTYKALTVESDKIRITFDNIGSGLAIGNPPEHFYIANKKPVPTAPPTELQGFAVMGADKKYVWAKATIDGDTVVVSSDTVPNPTAVRYAWADNPEANLYNKEGLPARPFRTDDLPLGR